MATYIDINQLLRQEQSRLVKKPIATTTNTQQNKPEYKIPTAEELTKETQQLLGTIDLLILSNLEATLKTESYYFAIILTKESLHLTEFKQGKHRLFALDFQKQYLSVEQKRATPSHFEYLIKKLKSICAYTLQSKSRYFIGDSSTHTPFSLAVFKTISAIHRLPTPALNELLQPPSFDTQMASYLLTLSRQLVLPPEHRSHSPQLETVLAEKKIQLKKQLLTLLGSTEKYVITNRKIKNRPIESLYALLIQQTKMTYTEQNSQIKKNVQFDFETNQLTINEQNAGPSQLEWVKEKIRKTGSDLRLRQAQLFKK